MAKIIISYRRSDSDVFAGRVRDRIAGSFGEDSVFIDVDNIPFGKDFRVHIQEALAKADAVLVVVGPKWLGAGKGGHSRITDDTDPVRIEVETALGKGIPTIPILVGQTKMPTPELLPESLRSFAFINAAPVDTGRDFHRDLNRVIATINTILERPADTAEAERKSHETEVARREDEAKSKAAGAQARPSKRALMIGSLIGAAFIAALGAWLVLGRPPSVARPPSVVIVPGPIVGAVLSPEQERALKPKDTFKECEKCPEMVVVPAGSFTMGSPASELGRSSNEIPQHRVTFALPFAVGKFALTFDEWDACVIDGGCNGYKPSDQGWGRGSQPAINVSWDNAKAYLDWLSKRTGKSYRLLSEAEREYVTRAGTTTVFWWGNSISTSQANYNGSYTYGNGVTGENRARALPVNSFAPNPWGLYQVHGNVWDWTEDCYHDSYERAPGDGVAWASGDCSRHLVRGGSWFVAPEYLRSAYRSGFLNGSRFTGLGFRVGRTLLAP